LTERNPSKKELSSYLTAIRIVSSTHKIIEAGGKVGYTATDSVYTDLPLHTMPEFSDVIGNDLGQFRANLNVRVRRTLA
jgi:hypothetical protein